jgi:GTP-binding protein EngB required for normal cell division
VSEEKKTSGAQSDPVRKTPEVSINDNHRRSIAAAFRYIDGLLVDVETTAVSAASPFSRFYPDLTSAQQGILADYIARIRKQMLDVLERLAIPVEPPRNPATWSIQTALSFARLTIQEISPEKLRGYGALDERAAAGLARLEADLDRTIRRLQTLLAQNLGKDLAARLERLEEALVDLKLLRKLQRIIAARGLIEFQGALEALVERLESKSFEIALFGRVSSGKSSLLNTVLEFDALPVGVTPVTSVPTRVVWGNNSLAEIRFADAPEVEITFDQLADYVSERGNPGNRKHVVRALVRIPSPKLRQDVVFVDTPGVGSLATSGGRESYAYLPHCDLGILLIDASSAPAPEDLEILWLLYESGIPAMVVISKADLLSASDQERLREYVQSEIASRLGLDLPVSLVSTEGMSAALAHRWFDEQIVPLARGAPEHAELSARRKLASLHEGVVAALRVALRGLSGPSASPEAGKASARIEEFALQVEGLSQETSARCDRLTEEARIATRAALALAAREYASQIRNEPGVSLNAIVQRVLGDTAQDTRARLRKELLGLRESARDLLRRMAGELPGASARLDELALDLVTQPSFSMPSEVERSRFQSAGWLRRLPSFVERRTRGELVARLDGPVSREFWSFANRTREWVQATLSAFSARFAAQSEPMRAQARRLTESADVLNAEEVAEDLRDIEGIDRPEPILSTGPNRIGRAGFS